MSKRALVPAKPSVVRPVASAPPQGGLLVAEQAGDEHDAISSDAPRFATQSFADLEPHARGHVDDVDDARALITRTLLAELASKLGLDPSRIRIQVNTAAEARINAAGASGVQEGGAVYLHPTRYSPQTPHGRYLLAHEVAHIAQRGVQGPVIVRDAESEARDIGRAFAERRPLRRARKPLGLRRAADSGEETAPPPLEASEKLIAAAVSESRSREIAEIRKALSGLWISDGDVFDVMRILDSVSFVIANGIIRALSEKERYELADNINPPHVYKYRRSVLACYYNTLSDSRLRDAVDLKVFRALPAVGMSTEEMEAAADILKHLSDSQRQELLGSENGPAIKRIISAPRPSAEELHRIQKDAAEDAAREGQLAQQRKAILAHKTDAGANTLLDQVRRLLTTQQYGDHTQNPNQGTAVQALDLLQGSRAEGSRFLYLAEQLEQDGLIDELLELLPANSYFDRPEHSETLMALVGSRLPYKNEILIENLLSYGLFDWAIRDYEAVFAYKLITALPLSQRYKFQQRDGGKWYLRLLENLPRDRQYVGLEIHRAETKADLDEARARYKTLAPGDQKELAVQEIKENGETKLFFDASQLYKAKLDKDKGARQSLDDLIADFREGKKDSPTLYRELVLLGGSSLEPGRETPGDELLRESIIHELDRLGYIERLFGDLRDSFLFAEENRVSTVKIMLARDPARVQAHARELVSRGFTDWMVTDREAYLAYMCVKALPADEREAFVRDNATEWGRIQSEMSESMRQSRDLNLYIGDKAGTDRGSVLGQLAEAATWTEENAPLLGDLVRMAIAMTEHRFAFERSKEFKAIDQPKLAPLVEKYRLWDPRTRPAYTPDILKGTRWYEEGIFADLRTLWSGLVTLWNLDVLFVENKIGAKVDLNDVQNVMGGDLGGAKLGDPKKRGANAAPPGPDANKLTLLVGTDSKSAELILPELLIDSANVQLAGSTLQSGEINLKGLHIHAAYDQEDMSQPTQAHVSLQSVVANDVLLAKSNSMITVTRIALSMLRLAAGTIDTVTGGSKQRKGRSVPFPLLVVPLLAMFVLLALPIYLYKKIAGWIDEGLESNPAERFAGDVAARTKAIDFSFNSLDVDSITTSGGQHVGHVGVRDFAVRVGLNKATRLRAEQASIAQRLRALAGQPQAGEAIEKLKTRKAQLDAEQATVEKDEQEYLQIQQQILKGGLSAEQQTALQKRLDALNFEDKGGTFIDIGSVEASGLSGSVTSKEPIRIANVHGEGGSAALTQIVALPTATNAELSRRSAAGERPTAPLDGPQGGTLSLELGDVHTGELSIGGGIRTVADIDQKLKELEDVKTKPEIEPLVESLQALRTKAERYELMVRHGVSSLTAPQLEEFRALREQLRAQADLIVKSIDITRAKVDIDVASGRVDVGAEAVRVAGVQLPGKGIDIDEVVARGLGVGALPAGGLLKWHDWKKNLQNADGKVDELQVSGVRSKYHGLLFEKATLTGGYAKMKDRGDLLEVGLKRLSVEGIGVAPRIGLLNQRLAGLKEKARVANDKDKPKLDAEIAKLSGKIVELQALSDARVSAYRALEAAKTPKEIEAAKAAVAESDTVIALGLAQYGASSAELDDFGIRATGAGDVLTDVLGSGLDVDRILRRGVRVQGTGPDNRVLRRFKVTGANAKEDQPDSSYVGKGDFELGETKLNLHAQRIGDSAFVDLDQFSIASLTLSEMLLTADQSGVGLQVGSSGLSSLEDVRLSGKVRLDKRPKTEGRFPEDFRFAHAEVTDFRIGAMRANGLTYNSIPDKISVTVKSGSIEGIWASGVSVDFPEDGGKASVLGSAGVDKISDVDVAAAMSDGLVRGANGRISGKNLQVKFLKEGEIEASIGDLNATAFSLRGPDGWARFSLNHLSGKVGFKNGVLDIKQLNLGSFEVPAVHWKVGAKGFVEADQPVSIRDVQAAGRIETSEQPGKAKPGETSAANETRVDKVKITRLHVGTMQAQHLIYQDENTRIEIGPDEAAQPKHMKGFQPLLLKNLDVWGLNWERGVGVSTGKAKLEKYEGSASYQDAKDLKAGLKVGVALTGGGMTAEVTGPGVFGVDIGKIDKIRGTYRDQKTDTKFATGQVGGTMAFGPDFVEARDVEISGVNLGKTTYKDPPREVGLQHVFVEKVKLGKVRQNFTNSTDPDKHDEKVPDTLEVENLEFFEIHVGKFTYDGSSTGKTPDGKDETTTQHVEGQSASIEHLKIDSFVHDAARSEDILSLHLDSGGKDEKVWSPLRVRGLAANLSSKIGGKESTTKLVTDIEGGPLTADKIKFATVKLGTVTGPGGKPQDVTRTSIDGSFNLTRLGFINPDLTMTGADGKITKISAYDYGTLEITGITPRFLPNGAVSLPIDAVVAKNLQLQRGEGGKLKPGDLTAKIPLAEIKNISLGLKGLGTKDGLEVLAAKVGSLSASRVEVDLTIDRSIDSSNAGYQKRLAAYREGLTTPKHALIAEPLSGLRGDAEVEPEHVNIVGPANLPWDPNETLPIRNGKINFDQVHPYAVNIHKGRLTIGNFWPEEHFKALDLPADLPGVHPEEGSHGALNLRELVEGLYSAPATEPKKDDKAADLSGLKNVNLGVPSLALGAGKIGLDLTDDKTLGPGDVYLELENQTPTDNTLTIPWQHIGDQVELKMPHLHAKGAGLPQIGALPGGTTKDIDVFNLYVRIEGLAEMSFKLHVWVDSAKIKDIELGDLTFLNPADLAKLKAPELKDVQPEAKP